MSRIVVFGSGGALGSRVVAEAAGRGHHVIAAVRELGGVTVSGEVEVVLADATSRGSVAELARGADVFVTCIGGPDKTVYLRAAQNLVSTLAPLGDPAPRIVACGGGGSLLGPDGARFVDAPDFPAAYYPDSHGQTLALDFYRASTGVTWTYVSPPPGNFAPGERRGAYRTGSDQPVVDDAGQFGISYEDFAVAVVDEIETPRHLNARFTVGY